MKRLAPLLAVAVLGSGCIVTSDSTPCDASVTIQWPSFRLANNTVTTSCDGIGIGQAWVTVYIDGRPVTDSQGNTYHFNCYDGGAVIYGLHDGSQLVTVEVVDGTDYIVLRQEFTLSVSGCGAQTQVVEPGEGTVDIGYAFSPTNVCYSATSYMWFSIYDRIVGDVTVSVGPGNTDLQKRTYLCGEPITFALPEGTYRLQKMEEWNRTGTNVYAVTGVSCTPQDFGVVAGAANSSPPLTVTLVDANGLACP